MQKLPVSASRPRRGAITTEHLFGGALAILIIVAVVLTLNQTLFRGSGDTADVGTPHFKCLDCDHVFEVEEIPRERIREARDPAMVLLDCPSCGAESKAIKMVRCPKCKEYFVSDRHLYTVEHGGEGAPDDVREICPHCGTDRQEYLEENQ